MNPETGTPTQRESINEALASLREATELYLEEFPLPDVGQSIITTFKSPRLAAKLARCPQRSGKLGYVDRPRRCEACDSPTGLRACNERTMENYAP